MISKIPLALPLCFLLFLPAFSAAEPEWQALIANARRQIGTTIHYDGSYEAILYPGGDVDPSRGVCTDVVIRAYRGVGLDLQVLVHEDMKKNFAAYPSKRIWGLSKPDKNIDHRRVPNLQKFFQRQNAELSKDLSRSPAKPGDLLTWMLPGNLPHIGIVSDKYNSDRTRYLILHNIGNGTKEEDIIDKYPLTGHYRYSSSN